MHKLFYIFLVVILFSSTLKSQNQVSTDNSVATIESAKSNLPDLKVFIDSALNNSPLLRVNDLEIDKLLQEIKINKKKWMQYITIDANTKYGLYNQLAINDELSTETPDIAIKSNKEQFNYFAGLSVKIPLTTFSTKKNEQKILNYSIEEYKLKNEQLKKEIRSFVIEEYYKLVNYKEVLDITQNALQIMKFNYLKSEREVQNGVLSIADFSIISANYYKSEENYSKAKTEFKSQINKLNVLTGITIVDLSK